MTTVALAEKWLHDHEHYPHDPSYVQDLKDLVTLLDSCSAAQHPQRQCSLAEQLEGLIPIANRTGRYDAADFLTQCTKR